MGYFSLILHAHLPFVRHPEHEQSLEEEWLFEAITETYIPLLRMMQRLSQDGVPFKLTMSLTPALAAMLNDRLLRARYVHHLDLLIDLMQRECARTRQTPELLDLAKFYHDFFCDTRRIYVDEGTDPICWPRRLSRSPAVSRLSLSPASSTRCRSFANIRPATRCSPPPSPATSRLSPDRSRQTLPSSAFRSGLPRRGNRACKGRSSRSSTCCRRCRRSRCSAS